MHWDVLWRSGIPYGSYELPRAAAIRIEDMRPEDLEDFSD
jgi:hypothetical protein